MNRVFEIMSQGSTGIVLACRQQDRGAAKAVKLEVGSLCGSGLEVDDDMVYVIIDLEQLEAARLELLESGYGLCNEVCNEEG
jgi:hypothetical protein